MKWARQHRALIVIPLLLVMLAIIPALSMGLTWVQDVGLLSADAVVFASDAPAMDRFMARAMKGVYGSRVQVCDGTADQVEIMAAYTAAGNGSDIKLSAGNFYIGAAITGSWSGVKLEGAGQYATIITQAYAGDVFDISCYRAEFRGFEVLGDNTTYASGSGMKMALNESILEDIVIRGFAECGIESDSVGTRILTQYRNVRAIQNEQYGLKLTFYDRDSVILGCSLSGNGLDGFYSEGWGYRFTDTWISDCGGHGIYARAPIWVVNGNAIQDNGEEGIHLFGVAGGSRSVIVTGNNFMDNGQTTDNTYYSIQLETSVTANTNWIDHITIANNQFVCYTAANQAAGHIYLNGHKSNYRHTEITGNTFDNGDTGPVKDYAAFSTYSGSIAITGNSGFIMSGELRTYAVTITAGSENTTSYFQNPFPQAVWITDAHVVITTAATAGNPVYDMAVDTDGSGLPDGAALFADIPDTPATYWSWSNAYGGAASGVQTGYVTLGSNTSTSDWLGFAITSDNGTGLVATAYITLMGK